MARKKNPKNDDTIEQIEGALQNWSTYGKYTARSITYANPFESGYIREDIPFKVNNQSIDYFKIPIDRLIKDGFTAKKIEIPNVPGGFLNFERDFQKFKMTDKETVIFNFQVGKGKTTICYELIKKYSESGNIVIVCSPFKKLVEKDYSELTLANPSTIIRNYIQIDDLIKDDFTISDFVKCNIHVMTINCLLQNPGNDRFEQSAIKRDYLNAIKQYAKHNKKKVIIFFDEIHESISNFHSILLPSLYSWKEFVHKCFISSATFIEASVPVIKYIGLLTNKCIRVFESDRIQQLDLANIHLHITEGKYNQKRLNALLMLKDIIKIYHPISFQELIEETNRPEFEKNKSDFLEKLAEYNSKKIIILSGYKSIVKSLLDKSKLKPNDKSKSDRIIESITYLFPKILTSDTDEIFDESSNYIGTTFKTGINIKDQNSIYIIIIPVIENDKKSNGHYGIFSDGIPSIIQAIARKRSKGDIHIITHMPNESILLGNEDLRTILPTSFLNGKKVKSYAIQNNGYIEIEKNYNRRRDKIKTYINDLKEEYPNYHYPSLEDYFITSSQNLLVKNLENWGKGLSPYILWASLNNQFCNAELKTITNYIKQYNIIYLKVDKESETLFSFVKHKINEDLKDKSIIDAFEYVRSMLMTTNNFMPNKFSINKRTYIFEAACRLPLFNQSVLNISEYLRINKAKKVSKYEYIRRRITEAKSKKQLTEIDKLYIRLDKYNDIIKTFVTSNVFENDKGEILLHKDLYLKFPEVKLLEIFNLLLEIKDADSFFSKYFFSLLQGFTSESEKSRIYKTTFTEIRNIVLASYKPSERRSFKGEKDAYFVLK